MDLARFALDDLARKAVGQLPDLDGICCCNRLKLTLFEKFAEVGITSRRYNGTFNAWIDDWNLKGKTWEQLQAQLLEQISNIK